MANAMLNGVSASCGLQNDRNVTKNCINITYTLQKQTSKPCIAFGYLSNYLGSSVPQHHMPSKSAYSFPVSSLPLCILESHMLSYILRVSFSPHSSWSAFRLWRPLYHPAFPGPSIPSCVLRVSYTTLRPGDLLPSVFRVLVSLATVGVESMISEPARLSAAVRQVLPLEHPQEVI